MPQSYFELFDFYFFKTINIFLCQPVACIQEMIPYKGEKKGILLF